MGDSDHVPVGITLRSEDQEGKNAETIFVPAVRRLEGQRLGQVRMEYEGSLPTLADKFSEVGSVAAFHRVCEKGSREIHRPSMLKVRKKPEKMKRVEWSAEIGRIEVAYAAEGEGEGGKV